MTATVTMKLSVFSAHEYDKTHFTAVQEVSYPDITLTFHSFPLTVDTAPLAAGATAVCAFVNDTLSSPVLEKLASLGIRAVFLRCAGYNNIDIYAAERLGMTVANVPSYSPESIAEFSVALLLTLNRKTHRSYNRVREGNFSLEGLTGSRISGKTVGLVGVGRIGMCFARIMKGFGCRLIGYDPYGSKEFEELGNFVALDELLAGSDIISLHCPLLDSTKHIINAETLEKMKKGTILVNASRGGLIDAPAALEALKNGQLGGLAMDVYELEKSLFYADHSAEIISDDTLMRLMTLPNVIVSGHQAFLTEEALNEIASVTLYNAAAFEKGNLSENELVRPKKKLEKSDSLPIRV